MPEVWPPAPTDQPAPPPAPEPSGDGRDFLVAACLALGLLPVTLALVVFAPRGGAAWWPYAFAAALGGLLIAWMYGFFGGLMHCRSRDARLALAVSLGGPGFALTVYQVSRALGHRFQC